MIYKEIDKCRLCGSKNLKTIISLGDLILTGVFPGPNETVESGPLELVKCFGENGVSSCGLVQLRHTYDLEILYGENYGYRSGLNSSMVDQLNGIVREAEQMVTLKNGDLVLDIASNDGTLLGAYQNKNLKRLGIDPTSEKFKQYYQENIEYIPKFFSSELIKRCYNQKARIITSIAMFYDLEDPIDFMRQIHDILDDDGVWITEQSYLPLMITQLAYDTICHEHLEYYALTQLKWMADRADLKIIDVDLNDSNGGSFRVKFSKKNSLRIANEVKINKILNDEEANGYNDFAVYQKFKSQIEVHKLELINLIAKLKKGGKKIFGLGASTKGNVILQYCNFNASDIPYIAEVNDYKFGRLTPGSNIPIISEREARALKPDYFLVLPWHFRNNILKREKDYLNSGGQLIFPLPKIEII